jgi:hypothetical protein
MWQISKKNQLFLLFQDLGRQREQPILCLQELLVKSCRPKRKLIVSKGYEDSYRGTYESSQGYERQDMQRQISYSFTNSGNEDIRNRSRDSHMRQEGAQKFVNNAQNSSTGQLSETLLRWKGYPQMGSTIPPESVGGGDLTPPVVQDISAATNVPRPLTTAAADLTTVVFSGHLFKQSRHGYFQQR